MEVTKDADRSFYGGDKNPKFIELNNAILEKYKKLNSDSLLISLIDDKDEYLHICEALCSALMVDKLSRVAYLYKEMMALFLVGTAKYHYNNREGGVWEQVEDVLPYIDVNKHGEIAGVFNFVIEKYNLPKFEDEQAKGYKLITRIICHAGIPIHCLDSWFDVVNQLRGVRYADLDNEIDFMMRYADKPVKRYINFLLKRGILADEVQNVQDFLDCLTDYKNADKFTEYSIEFKDEAYKWIGKKRATGVNKFEKYERPEILLDDENFALSVCLPEWKSKDNNYITWEVLCGKSLVKKRVYGKRTKNGYGFSGYEIPIRPAEKIIVELYDAYGNTINDFCLTSEKCPLVFGSAGKQIKGKVIPKKPTYFICDNECSVCDNLQSVYEYDDYTIYVNNPELSKEVRIGYADKEVVYTVKEPPVLIDGQLLFDGNAVFENIDAYRELPKIAVPYSGEWGITILNGNNERVDCVRFIEDKINVKAVIFEEYGAVDYGTYRIRIKHAKCGFYSYKFMLLPQCSFELNNFYPSKYGYAESLLKFSCADGVEILDSDRQKIGSLMLLPTDDIFAGFIQYKQNAVPFKIILKAFTWKIFNEEKSFSTNNTASYIRSGDIKESMFVMINVHNFTDKNRNIEVKCGDSYSATYNLPSNRSVSLNLKEFSEHIEANASSTVAITVSDSIKFVICVIERQLCIKELTCRKTYDGNIIFEWEEDGALKDREFVIANALSPYRETVFEVADGVKYIGIKRSEFDKTQCYLVFVRHKKTIRSSIYGDIIDNEKVDEVKYRVINSLVLKNLSEAVIKDVIKLQNPTLEQAIYSYTFLFINKRKFKDEQLNYIYSVIIEVYKEIIIEYRCKSGDVEFYRRMFEYEVADDVFARIFDDLGLIIPCFTNKDLFTRSEEKSLKQVNLAAYISYLYTTEQNDKITDIKQDVENLVDEHSMATEKANRIYPNYHLNKEFFTSVQEWKRVKKNGKWLTEAESLGYELIERAIYDYSKRKIISDKDFIRGCYEFYKSHEKTYVDILISRLEKRRANNVVKSYNNG